ncbi:MAG: hypothetical protein OHK0048_08410 [Rhodoferax sp.]
MKTIVSRTLFLGLVASAAITVHSAEPVGDAAAGAQKNALCIGCHGIKGYHISFPQVHKVPKISGQSAGYIRAALKAYRSGERKHPSMKTVAAGLSDQDIADLAAYYAATGTGANLPPSLDNAPAAAEALLAKGGCVGCHGPNMSSPIDASYPKVAGQHGDYLFVALRAYKDNERPLIGRANPIMGGVAKQFSNAELKVLADYLATLPTELQTVQRDRVK